MEPKVIYMQKSEDGDGFIWLDTWNEEKINDDDIAYVLESSILALQEENKRYKLALEWISNSNTNGYTTGEGHSDCVYKARAALNGGKNG